MSSERVAWRQKSHFSISIFHPPFVQKSKKNDVNEVSCSADEASLEHSNERFFAIIRLLPGNEDFYH